MTTTTLRTLDPRDLIRSVFVWALLIPLALLAFLAAELTHIDMVDAVNALVYACGALLSVVLARQAPPHAGLFGRAFWLAAAALCVIFVLSELDGDVVEAYEETLSPYWLGECICWAGAGIFLLAVAWSRPRSGKAGIGVSVFGLLAAGFAFQSMAFGLDIGETHLQHRFGLDPLSYDNLTDLVEFSFLQLYLLAFIALAAELTAQHALSTQIAAAEAAQDPAACLRIAQLAFTTAAFDAEKFSRRRLYQALTSLAAGSGFGGVLGAIRVTRRMGPTIRQRTGKSLAVQFIEQMRFMFRHRMAPKNYYLFELFDPARGRDAAHYLQRSETKAAAYKIMHRPSGQRMSEKLEFHNRCRALGLPVAPVVFATANGRPDAPFADTVLPAVDLFIKPRKGSGGRGATRWTCTSPQEGPGPVQFTHADGMVLDAAALRQTVIDYAGSNGLLVQTTLVNHEALADINCGTLATVRIVSCRNENGAFEVTDAAFRMPRVRGSAVDNFHAGGIAAAVDIATGSLGAATDMGLSPRTGWFDTHPVTGAQIRGRVLPDWQAARDLAERAHVYFDDFAVIGWDIALLPDGPCLIEANGAPDLDIIQRTTRRPLGTARLGRLIAWHVKRDLRPNLLDPAL